MKRVIILALMALVFGMGFSTDAEAKRYKKKTYHKHHVHKIKKTKRVVQQVEPCFFFCEQQPVTHAGGRSNRRVVGVSGIVAPLAAKVAQIQAACGSTVISGVRHTRIAGTRRMSLHAQGKAVDMVGNPSCMYSQLHGWSGGYSIDYGRMRHIHISYDADGGREMGLRFNHGGHRKFARKHARHRYAHAR